MKRPTAMEAPYARQRHYGEMIRIAELYESKQPTFFP
jgi:hypothetical protein